MKRFTWLLMLAVFAIVVGYDVVAYNYFPAATISTLTDGFAEKHAGAAMGICLAVGYLLGHLFWPQYRNGKK